MGNSEWKKRIEMEREQKDTFFSVHPGSPVPMEERALFKGLEYFPPDPGYRFELDLSEHSGKRKVTMAYTKGDEQEFVVSGEFRFQIGNKSLVLQAYRSSDQEDNLFVPFKDATCGKETYGAGRYIDLDCDRDRTPEGKWVIDFNRAYNPWCAYSEQYTCPFVPPENWLDVQIRAGEKSYSREALTI